MTPAGSAGLTIEMTSSVSSANDRRKAGPLRLAIVRRCEVLYQSPVGARKCPISVVDAAAMCSSSTDCKRWLNSPLRSCMPAGPIVTRSLRFARPKAWATHTIGVATMAMTMERPWPTSHH